MRRCHLLLAVLCAGCAAPLPRTPQAAQAQLPGGAPLAPWTARGRLVVSWPGTRQSFDLVLRGRGGGVRAALLADAGVLIADAEISSVGVAVHHAAAGVRERALPLLLRVVNDVYAPRDPAAERIDGLWREGRLAVERGGIMRWYGGDPLLLRRAEDCAWRVEPADYRPLGHELIAYAVDAVGPWGARIELRLGEARR